MKKDVEVVRAALPRLSQEELRAYLAAKITVGGIELGENDLTFVRVLGKGRANADESKWEPAFTDMIVLLDRTIYPELTEEGLARDLISRVQKLRKKAGLSPTDDVPMQYSVVDNPDGIDVTALVSSREQLFQQSLCGRLEHGPGPTRTDGLVLEEQQVIGKLTLLMRLVEI